MTTTPTASPELLGLDHLEALARAATPGPWAYQEDSDAYTHLVRPVASPGWIIASATQTSKPEGEANGRWIAAANPAAVLALIALARRAQPEGEAPSNEELERVWENHVGHPADFAADVLQRWGGWQPGLLGYGGKLAAVLAAQQAAPTPRIIGGQRWSKEAEMTEGWLAAQQAAAPGSSPEIPDSSISVPVTPEAPDEARKGAALWRATLRACGGLPDGYEVRIELENGCGMVAWYDERGERHVIDGEGYLSDDVNEAVDLAIQRAAAPKGGA